jgi:DNA-binding NtrC family response regulator
MTKGAVLIVDSDNETLELFHQVLSAGGYDVAVGRSADEAVRIVKHRQVFAAFIDVQMPGIDGIQLLKDIRSARRDTHVIVMTGCSRDETVSEALRHGCFVCLLKPLKLRDIAGVMDVLEAVCEPADEEAA